MSYAKRPISVVLFVAKVVYFAVFVGLALSDPVRACDPPRTGAQTVTGSGTATSFAGATLLIGAAGGNTFDTSSSATMSIGGGTFSHTFGACTKVTSVPTATYTTSTGSDPYSTTDVIGVGGSAVITIDGIVASPKNLGGTAI
jgi:hypothetical protein